MANNDTIMALQVVQFIFGMMSTTTQITVTVWPMWAFSSPDFAAPVLGPAWNWKGIWATCMQLYDGQYNCEEMQSMLTEEPYIMCIRAFMCLGIALSFLACAALLVGMQCSRFLDDFPNKKRKIVQGCGVAFAVTGVLMFVSMTWYVYNLVTGFFSPAAQDNQIRLEIGAAIFLGYVSCALSFTAALTCYCCPGPKEDSEFKYGGKQNERYNLRSPTENRPMDYI